MVSRDKLGVSFRKVGPLVFNNKHFGESGIVSANGKAWGAFGGLDSGLFGSPKMTPELLEAVHHPRELEIIQKDWNSKGEKRSRLRRDGCHGCHFCPQVTMEKVKGCKAS